MSCTHPRIAFLHTGAVVIAPVADLAREHLGAATTINYLDDKIVADLGDARAGGIRSRAHRRSRAGRAERRRRHRDADVLVDLAPRRVRPAERVGIPVLRIDEAMADEAVAIGSADRGARDAGHDPHPDDGADPRARRARRCSRPRSPAR